MSYIEDFINGFVGNLGTITTGILGYTEVVRDSPKGTQEAAKADYDRIMKGIRDDYEIIIPGKDTGQTKSPIAQTPTKLTVSGGYTNYIPPSAPPVYGYTDAFHKLETQLRFVQGNVLDGQDRMSQAILSHLYTNAQTILDKLDENTRILQNNIAQTNENMLSGFTQTQALTLATIENAIARVNNANNITREILKQELDSTEWYLVNELRNIAGGSGVDNTQELKNIDRTLGWIKNEVHKLHSQLPATLMREYALYLEQGLIDVDQSANVGMTDGLLRFLDLVKNDNDVFEQASTGWIDRLGTLNQITNDIATGKYNSIDEVANDLNEIMVGFDFLFNLAGTAITALTLVSSIYEIVQAYSKNIEYLANVEAGNYRFPPEQILMLLSRPGVSESFIDNELKQLGFNDERINLLKKIRYDILNETEIRELSLRGFISDNKREQFLEQIGVTGEVKALKLATWYPLPPIQDLITMAVRDVFDSRIVNEFGFNEDYPEEFDKYAKQQGLTEEWARKYWQSHWRVPSANQGFEMFHRGIITREELEFLFKALDIAPKWRENLLKINYQPITRVDVRRMHAMGFLNKDEVVRKYQDIGYSPDDARLMGEWTEAYNETSRLGEDNNERELTSAQYLRLFATGIITRYDAERGLRNIGYNQENAEYLLRLYDYDAAVSNDNGNIRDNTRRIENEISKAFIRGFYGEQYTRTMFQQIGYSQEQINEEIQYLYIERGIAQITIAIDNIRERYEKYLISEIEVRDLLSSNGIDIQEQTMLLFNWQLARENRVRMPTKADVETFAKLGIIDVNKYYDLMRGLGYDDEIIGYFAQEIGVIQ